MPLIIRPEMTELEILRCVADTYGSASNYEAFDKDVDGSGRCALITPWVSRDQGAYARNAMKIIEAKRIGAALPRVAGAANAGV